MIGPINDTSASIRASGTALGASESPENIIARMHRLQGPSYVEIVRAFERSKAVDLAFGGELFIPDLDPTTPRNLARFRHYVRCHRQLLSLLSPLIDSYIQACVLEGIAVIMVGPARENQIEAAELAWAATMLGTSKKRRRALFPKRRTSSRRRP